VGADVSATPISYDAFDRERVVGDVHSSNRSDFQRDRGRIIHSSGFRRLAQKTQVLSPTSGVDFARNRLTHSLEVAQVGREIGLALGLDPDIVDAACLAHDLGHPPFGHNGESAVAAWATPWGGFEGNAQTFRALTRIEPKVFEASGSPRGLNLTRASLDASTKYPWFIDHAVVEGESRLKFGVYDDDREVFEWLRLGMPERHVTIEGQVMDLADDIAYSVHDFEDAIVGGYIRPEDLFGDHGKDHVLHSSVSWAGESLDADQIERAYSRLSELDTWPTVFDGSRVAYSRLKNFTSAAIGRFASSVSKTQLADRDGLPERYRWSLEVPAETRAEIALLKGIVARAVMSHETRQPIYRHQRELLTELLDALWAGEARDLDPVFAHDFQRAEGEWAKRRVIVDQVAALTDQAAIVLHERVTGG
jgi:dGTPase